MAPTTTEVDCVVLGGGSGGLAFARAASGKFGAKVLAIENKRLGGTCVNVGCVPKKVIYNAAALAEAIHDSKSYGFSRLNGIYERNLGNDKVEYLHGWGRVLNKKQIEVTRDDGEKVVIDTKNILVAVGGRPNSPPQIPGAEYGINSDGFFDIERQPKKAVIIGAGYIAVEFAGMLNALESVTKEYERLGVNLHKKSQASKIEKQSNGKLTVTFQNGQGDESVIPDVDNLIWAIGRTPETVGIGLQEAGIKINSKGYIEVDEYQNTTVDNIFALGDVTGQIELTPVAIATDRKLASRLFGGSQFSTAKLSYHNVPSVVFAHPEVGSIGLTELQAMEKFGKDNIRVYKTSFTSIYYAMMDTENKGPTNYKLIVTGSEEKVVGLHIMGMGSAEMLQCFGVAIKMGSTKADFDSCVAIHPVSAEELVTLK
ncbi:hypothetical protein F5883DRAFT_700006 [Diaporthe sp. PMI_573]|nr:hypothetical protein F5883DRAFT_700006 [Diaporthaceae sp. PMI_573]